MPRIIGLILAMFIAFSMAADVQAQSWKDWMNSDPESNILDGWKDAAVEKAADKISEFSAEIASTTPLLKTIGFELSTFRVQVLPPVGKFRLISTSWDTGDRNGVAIPSDASTLVNAILTSANTAKSIQRMMKLSVVVMDVEIGLTPTIKLSYLKDADADDGIAVRFQDLDLVCGQAFN